uniref:Major facilitator superfamily (MFS) profile domain-containing protein n=1 Tax=Clastoptera arizonana TaxID=38151 RepID=A0A1B6CUD4_9HEMI
MRYLGMFFRRITDDFRQKELLPLKLLFFVHASTLYVLYPYLTIHMRELGINVEEAAIMSAVTPIVAIIMPPLAGMVADRIGNFKFILAVFNGLGGATSLLLLLVPVGRITFTYPERTILSLGCPNNSSDGLLNINLAEQHECNTLSSIADTQFGNKSMIINAQLEACGLICTRHPNDFIPQGIKGPKTLEDESKAILSTRNYTVILKNILRNTSDQYTYTLKADDLPLYKAPRPEDEDKRNLRQMVNKQHYPTSVRKLTDMTYFFPTSGLYNFSCAPENEKNITESYLCNIEKINGVFPSVVASKARSLDMKIKAAQSKNAENINKLYVTDINVLHGNKYEFMDTICGLEEEIITQSVIVPLPNPENTLETDALLNLVDCKASCIMTLPRNKLCSNMDHTVEYDIRLTFWIYLVIRVFIGMISGTAFAMFEGAVIAILRNHKGDYGLQRIYAAIGGMISSPLSGILIDYASTGKGYTDFRPAFYLYAGLKIVSGVLMLSMNLQFKSPATNIVKDVMSVLMNIEIVALFITCFILGTAWGYIESFLFWLLQDLGASRSLMGITITIGGIAGLPLLVLSGPIIDRIGHANVLFIGFIFYAIRLMGYSLIYNPWMCLIFEAMESVTSSLAITAAVTYAAKLSTNTTDSSIQGLLGGLYFGVGKGAGSLIGGYLMKAVGTRPTYQIFSVVMLITGCLYYIFNHFYIVRRAHLLHKHDPDKKSNEFWSLGKQKCH